jgi:endonuclease/exonuclease/phosphatase family metal-dependent hydrolase
VTKNVINRAFNPPPERWGLRGDPELWGEIERCYDLPVGADLAQVQAHVAGLFSALTGCPMDVDDPIPVARYKQGGMSGGLVSPDFWRNVAQPLLLQRTCRGRPLSVFSWNVNNRVGRVPFRAEAADAAMDVGADVLVFIEFFAGAHLDDFQIRLRDGGWVHQALSQKVAIKANQILVASRIPIETRDLPPTATDEHLMSNSLWVRVDAALELFCSRVPTYTGEQRSVAWDWIARVAGNVRESRPALLIGDLNTSLYSRAPVPQFKALMRSWRRLQPLGSGSYYGTTGIVSEIDHALVDGDLDAAAWYVRSAGDFQLARSDFAISDHAGLFVQLSLSAS